VNLRDRQLAQPRFRDGLWEGWTGLPTDLWHNRRWSVQFQVQEREPDVRTPEVHALPAFAFRARAYLPPRL
jgi:hypothetical protein